VKLARRLWWTAYAACRLRGQERYPFRPIGAIRRAQARRVRRIVAYAWRHVPYYRETLDRLGLAPGDFRTAADLAKLPVIERGDYQRDPERFTSRAARPERCLCLRSSGSSGQPIAVLHDPAAVYTNMALGRRLEAVVAGVTGKRAGRRDAAMPTSGGGTVAVARFRQENALVRPGVRRPRAFFSCFDPPQRLVEQLNEFRPDTISGYGSTLAVLFGHVRDTGCPFHLPRAVLYGGDMMPEAARRLIEDDFGVAVLSVYQASEASLIGFECERHRGLHVNLDFTAVRIADDAGRTLPAGEPGDVITSNLVNRATVLLNYRLGDVAAWLPDPCPCGRSLPLLSLRIARCEDYLVLPSGQRAHPHRVAKQLEAQKDLRQYRLVQETPSRFTLTAVPAETCDREALARRVTAVLRDVFGPEAVVDVRFVASIPPGPSGKVRAVVSLCCHD